MQRASACITPYSNTPVLYTPWVVYTPNLMPIFFTGVGPIPLIISVRMAHVSLYTYIDSFLRSIELFEYEKSSASPGGCFDVPHFDPFQALALVIPLGHPR